MDFADEVSPLKRQKCFIGSDDDDDVNAADRLSDLPEVIIYHILSLLPMKSVVATSLLSKSWSLRWKGVWSYEFESRWWSSHGDFVDFVNNMLPKQSTMDKFCLKWENQVFGSPWDMTWLGWRSRVNEWLASAVCRKVGVVDVGVLGGDGWHLFIENGIELPGEIFTCKTLETLKLSGPFIIEPRVEVCLSKLVHLELILVHFNSELMSFRKLVRGCPVLKSFRFEGKLWSTPVHVAEWSISSPSLKHLEIYLHADNVFSAFRSRHYKLEIDAPALEKLVLTDRLSREFSIRGGSINEAHLDCFIHYHALFPLYQSLIVKLIQGLNHVKILKLSERTVEVLGRATNRLPIGGFLWSTPGGFKSLTKLVVELDYYTTWECLIDLIDCCPALEILEITHLPIADKDKISLRRYLDDEIRNLRTGICKNDFPRSSLSNLTRVVYKGRTGLDDEKAMLLLLLNPAIITKRVEVDLCSDFSDETPNFELTFSFV